MPDNDDSFSQFMDKHPIIEGFAIFGVLVLFFSAMALFTASMFGLFWLEHWIYQWHNWTCIPMTILDMALFFLPLQLLGGDLVA